MNLTEVTVAATVFVVACHGAAQIGASSAAAMTQSRTDAAALELIDAQFLAVAPLIAAARSEAPPPSGSCSAAALWMQSRLDAALPPLVAGMQRQLSLDPSAQQLQLAVSVTGGLRRMRILSPAAFGLCGLPQTAPPTASPAPEPQESTDAAL